MVQSEYTLVIRKERPKKVHRCFQIALSSQIQETKLRRVFNVLGRSQPRTRF